MTLVADGTPCVCERCLVPFRGRKNTAGRFCSRACFLAAQAAIVHAPRKRVSAEESVWRDMVQRCTNPTVESYPRYGGRGIRVCDRWLGSLADFVADMGQRPSSRHSIDRIDSDGDYGPGNCRWATAREQARNRKTNRLLVFRGETRCLVEWAEVLGLSGTVISSRLGLGWSVEAALSTPVDRVANSRRTKLSRSRSRAAVARESLASPLPTAASPTQENRK